MLRWFLLYFMAFDFTSCFDYNCDMTDGTCQDPEMNKFDLERCLTRFELFPPNEKCKTCILQKNLKNATSNFIDFAEVEQIFAMGNSYDDLGVPDNLFLIFDNARFLSFIGVHMANLTARYFQGASNLQAFTADGSSLMNLDAFVFSHAYNMKKIWMVQCRIESIHPDAFKNLTKLTLLDLSDNAFLDLDDELLSDLLDLTYLDISVNHLTSISDNFFKNLFKLEDLSLGDNKFKTIGCVFNDLQKLEFLYLENNILEEIYPEPCNHSLSSLTDLWLQGNNLKSVPKNLLKDSKSVTKLLLPSTIESIEKDDFEELENLKCMSIDGSKTGILNDRLFRVEINSFSSLSNVTNLHLRVLCTNQEWIDTVPINMSEVRKDLSASDCARCIVPQIENGIIVNAFEKETLSSNQFFKGTAKVECDQDYLYVVDNEDENKITCNIQKWNKQFPECLKLCVGNKTVDTTTISRCTYNGKIVPCTRNQAPGTMVNVTCNFGYKLPVNYTGSKMLTCLENGKWDGTSIKCNPICGRPTAKTSAYVIGGQDAKISDVPWSAGIYQLYRKKFKHICGGTILTKRIIISAAHCFFIEKKRQFASPDQFKVAVGKYFRGFYANESLPIQTFNVTEIIAIPHYSGYASSYTRDIAIIILDGSINFEPHIIPICIDIEAGYESETTLSAGSIGLVAGWGYTTATGMPSDTLKSIEMPVIDFYQCLNESGDYRPFVTPDKFCSGFKNGSGVCQGDSGSGLVFPQQEGGQIVYYIRGLVSNTRQASQGGCDNWYSLFTNVLSFFEPIQKAMEDFQ